MAGYVAWIGMLVQRGGVLVRLLLQVRVLSHGWLRERARTVLSFKWKRDFRGSEGRA